MNREGDSILLIEQSPVGSLLRGRLQPKGVRLMPGALSPEWRRGCRVGENGHDSFTKKVSAGLVREVK